MAKLVTGDEIRLFLLIALGLMIVTGGITALSVVLSKPPERKDLLPKESPFKAETDNLVPRELLLKDFLLPREGGTWLTRPWYFSRTPGKAWSEEDVQGFWQDPEILELDVLPEKNDRILDDLIQVQGGNR